MPFWWFLRPSPPPFAFGSPGPLVDGDLELVEPDARHAADVLAACRDPSTLADAPDLGRVSQQGLNHFLTVAPAGHHPGGGSGRQRASPAYHFWMRCPAACGCSPIAGGITLRIGDTPDLRRYIGHVGYNVYPFARGQHLAERSARLLLPLARRHGLSVVWITCNPDNAASHRTCQRLGAAYIDTVDVPVNHDLHARGERQKCRYRLSL